MEGQIIEVLLYCVVYNYVYLFLSPYCALVLVE